MLYADTVICTNPGIVRVNDYGNLGIYIAYDMGLFSKVKAEEFLALCMDELANYQVNPGQP